MGQISSADAGSRIPRDTPTIPGVKIPCYHEESGRFTPAVHPARCQIAGFEGEGRKFVVFPIKWMKWEKWGRFRSITFQARNFRTQSDLRVIAYRRVECADGQIWYSSVNVVNPRNGFVSVIRLPACRSRILLAG
jgi:hypothetical protein